MTRLLHPALPLTLAALVALGAVGCDRFWPSSNQTGAKDAAKDAGKPAQAAPQSVASLPSTPAAAPRAPRPVRRRCLRPRLSSA